MTIFTLFKEVVSRDRKLLTRRASACVRLSSLLGGKLIDVYFFTCASPNGSLNLVSKTTSCHRCDIFYFAGTRIGGRSGRVSICKIFRSHRNWTFLIRVELCRWLADAAADDFAGVNIAIVHGRKSAVADDFAGVNIVVVLGMTSLRDHFR